jgi:hypothetical protein
MPETKTQRIAVSWFNALPTGNRLLSSRLYQDTIPNLNRVSIGFDLLGGTKEEQAKKVADLLNEHVLDVFVTEKEKSET